MFMVLSSWHSHCQSSPGSFDECRLSTGWPPTLRPNQPIWAVPPIGCYHPQTPMEWTSNYRSWHDGYLAFLNLRHFAASSTSATCSYRRRDETPTYLRRQTAIANNIMAPRAPPMITPTTTTASSPTTQHDSSRHPFRWMNT